MKRLKLEQKAFGRLEVNKDIRVINIFVLSLVIIYNLMNTFLGSDQFIFNLIKTSPLLASLVIIIIIRNNKALSYVYLIVGLLTCLAEEYITGFSGIIFIIWAYRLNKNRFFGLLIVSTTLVTITFRFILNDMSVIMSIQMIIVYAFVFSITYLLFFQNDKQKIDAWSAISEKEKAILKLYMRGYDYAKISRTLNLTDKKESIRTIITRVRIKSECENDIQFGIWLSEKG